MADTQNPKSSNAPPAKTRSPVERILVWGLIGVLAVAAGFEFQSKRAHETALKTLQDEIEAVDRDAKHPEVTEAFVKKVLGDKKPSRTKDYETGQVAANGAKRLEVYTWFTLNPSNTREMYVWYTGKGKDGKEEATVLEVQSTENVSAPPAIAAGGQDASGGAPIGPGSEGMRGRGMGPAGGPGGLGGQRGRPGGNPAAHDASKSNDDIAKGDAKAADDDKSDAEKPADGKKTEEEEKKTE